MLVGTVNDTPVAVAPAGVSTTLSPLKSSAATDGTLPVVQAAVTVPPEIETDPMSIAAVTRVTAALSAVSRKGDTPATLTVAPAAAVPSSGTVSDVSGPVVTVIAVPDVGMMVIV